MRNPNPYTNDSALWVDILEEVGRLLPHATFLEVETQARRFVAIVRRDREQGGALTWAPKDEIPDDITQVYDCDGDRWERTAGGPWSMPDFDDDEHESAAGEPHDDASLLRNYGPVTELPKRGTR